MFKEIKQKHGNKIINSGGIKTFVKSHRQIIKDLKETMPYLYEISQKSVTKFDEDRLSVRVKRDEKLQRFATKESN